ncbi:MerR family transcriptional regulator [Microbacterium sp. NPDC058342]|uniref:MerR family transcriptional regulator n=1 Tax=Microbacterium sp. NPDC058342 TaxID=3346454 RepID=UPI003666DF9A
MNSTAENLYGIGEVARRTGLSVSAIRYYADEEIVPPTRTTDAGHRLYDVAAVARLEFVRTLRDLDTGLDRIRLLVQGNASLQDLLAEHLETVEGQASALQRRRAVLRALVSTRGGEERLRLLQKLVGLTDAERERLVDDFWAEVTDRMPAGVRERIVADRPELPADPSPRQLDAWLTLADLLQDSGFREQVRAYLHDTYLGEPVERMGDPAVQQFIASAGEHLMPKLTAAHDAGLAADDPHVARLAAQFVEQSARAAGMEADDGLRQRLAAGYRRLRSLTTDALEHPQYRATHARYLALVATINGTQHPDEELRDASRPRPDGERSRLDELGEWLADALMAGA